MSKILQINKTGIRIRPSSIDNFGSCAYQWARVYLGGENGIPNARASIGTAIHAGVEVMWNDAIKAGKKDLNVNKIVDASVQEFQDILKRDEPRFDVGEDKHTAEKEIVNGTKTFVTDIAEFTPIPIAVEKFFEVKLNHPVISGIGGTIDYIDKHVIADVKTSKRKISPGGHVVQQSIYKYLAEEAGGYDIRHNNIQGVVLGKTKVYGETLRLEPNVGRAKFMVNSILDAVETAHKGLASMETLFRGNPKHYLCSIKYCAFYATCPFVNGEDIKQLEKPVRKGKPSL